MSFGRPEQAHTTAAERNTDSKNAVRVALVCDTGWAPQVRHWVLGWAAHVLLPVDVLGSCDVGRVPRCWIRVTERLLCCLLLRLVSKASPVLPSWPCPLATMRNIFERYGGGLAGICFVQDGCPTAETRNSFVLVLLRSTTGTMNIVLVDIPGTHIS